MSLDLTKTNQMDLCFDYSEIDSLAEVVIPTKDTNPKTIYGKAKPSLALVPGPALIHIATAFADGADKYGPANWRDDPVSTSTYVNAAFRHLLSYYDGERDAEDSGVHHLAHAAACLCILIDAEESGTLVDDRPTPGKSAAVIKRLTKKI